MHFKRYVVIEVDPATLLNDLHHQLLDQMRSPIASCLTPRGIHVLRLLLELCRDTGRVPPSLITEGFSLQLLTATEMGGFSDVYKVTLPEEAAFSGLHRVIAVKQLRQFATEECNQKVRLSSNVASTFY
jgi:hypothetical protein